MILKIKHEIVKTKKFLLFSFLLSFFIFSPNLICFTTINHLIIIFIFIFILFLFSIINSYIYILFSLFIVINSTIFTHIYTHWGYKTIDSRLEVALLSPKYEQLEYLQSYLNITDLFIFCYSLCSIYFLYLFNKHKIQIKSLKLISFFFTTILLIIISLYKNPFVEILPLNLLSKYIRMQDRINQINTRTKYLEKISFIKNHKIKNLKYEKIIIVIGESASKYHMPIYGYPRETTPFFKKNNFHIFNAISPANQTRYALAISLTNATVKNFKKFFISPSLITNLKNYGYSTYWISNQGKAGQHETYITSIANEAEHKYFLNINYHLSKTDIEIIKTLNNINIEKGKKQAFFFHLIGSHFDYKNRYLKNNALIQSPKNIIDEYDNSIFFTDLILSKIYQKFKNEKILLIYFSDHGEVVSENKFGHGFLPPFKDEYDVPLVMYSSIPNKKIFSLKNKQINMETFNNLVTYIVNIDDNLSSISTSNNVMALEHKNIYDYNKLMKYKKETK